MNTQSSYFKLGLFVVTAVTLLVASVIILGAGERGQAQVGGVEVVNADLERLRPGR